MSQNEQPLSFAELMAQATTSAFHLEMRDSYAEGD